MNFSEKLRSIQSLIFQDTSLCIQTISSQKFINSLFFQELKSVSQMFEQTLTKKGVYLKGQTQGKNLLRPQIVIAFYSVIIMRANAVNVRQEIASSVATKVEQNLDPIFNSKLAIETLSKIYKNLEESDQIKMVITGLLFKIRGFNNYKMVVKDIDPNFISEQTMDLHYEGLKHQCPNLLEIQLLKYKQKWSKYLKFKPISLSLFQNLLTSIFGIENDGDAAKWDGLMENLEGEAKYLHGRLKNIQTSDEVEKINIDEIISHLDSLYIKISEKLKEFFIPPKKANSKIENVSPEYDYKQFVLKNYLKIFGLFLSFLNQIILTFQTNWIRKIKWLYNFVTAIFVNFGIKTNHFHASIASEYAHIVNVLTQVLMSYLVTFKNGLFPMGKLEDFAFNEQFSIYKLVEALLYNEYPFNQADAVVFQNYQKQKKNIDNKQRQQHIIDIVNFNMKSLNINPHWDNMLTKLIPNLKNSHIFAKKLVYQAIYFLLQYFKITNNYQHAAKLILMLANAKNAMFVSDKNIKRLINELRELIYPGKQSIKEGIQYFCQEYFNEYIRINRNRELSREENENRIEKLQYFHCQGTIVNSPLNERSLFRMTESRDKIMEGWQENFESVKDSSLSDMKGSNNKNPMLQSSEMVNSQVFYSVKEGVTQKESLLKESLPAELPQNKLKQDQEILIPDFG